MPLWVAMASGYGFLVGKFPWVCDYLVGVNGWLETQTFALGVLHDVDCSISDRVV